MFYGNLVLMPKGINLFEPMYYGLELLLAFLLSQLVSLNELSSIVGRPIFVTNLIYANT